MNKIKQNTIVPFILCMFFLLTPAINSAQSNTFSGAIVIGKAEVMSYQIVYEITKDNTISGYSLCDVNGKQETKASIKGKYFPKNRKLTFREMEILSTKMDIPKDEFCLMNVEGQLSKKDGKSIFNGKFRSKAQSNEIECDSGNLVLLSAKALDLLASKVNKATASTNKTDNIKKPDITEKKDINLPPVPAIRNVIELSSGMVKEIELKADKVYLDIVDDRFQDGDRIKLLRNQAVIANSLEITNEIKTFEFQIEPNEKETTFTIIAEDEGSIALTTIKAALRNGDEVNLMIISLNKGESVKFILNNKK